MRDVRHDLWIYWHNWGWRTKPPLIQACIDSAFANSGCDVRLCGITDAFELLPELPREFGKLSAPHQSDVFRIGVLSKYGGMYVDADTFVLKSLRPLFGLLSKFEFVGMDWRPRRRPPEEWLPLGIGILGPARPNLPFLAATYAQQLELLRSKRKELALAGQRHSLLGKMRGKVLAAAGLAYPVEWNELLRDPLLANFNAHRPRARLVDGAATWGALVGGPDLQLGELGHPLRSMNEIGGMLPDTELLTLANSLLPRRVRWGRISDLQSEDTILAALLKSATRR